MNGLLTQQRQSTWQATKSILENYMFSTKKYYVGDNTLILAHGEGKVKFPTVNSTREIVLDLHQVLFEYLFIYLFIFVIYYLQSPT